MIAAATPALGPLGDRILDAVDSPGFAPVSVLVAFAAGAMHACAPGHGKSLAAAYLVGSHGRRRDAIILGTAVAAMHTVSVVAIGLVWVGLSATETFDTGPVTETLQVLAGAMVIVVGVLLVRRRRRHSHDHHHHHHPPADDQRRPGLMLLGVSGGLVPSPAAFLVLLTGIFSGRTALALLLVAVFGLGMAVVLTAVGLATVGGRELLGRFASSTGMLRRAARIGPAVAAWGVLVAGCVITAVAIGGTSLV